MFVDHNDLPNDMKSHTAKAIDSTVQKRRNKNVKDITNNANNLRHTIKDGMIELNEGSSNSLNFYSRSLAQEAELKM